MIELKKSALLERAGFHLHGFTKRSGGVSIGAYHSLNLAHDVGDDPEAVDENLRRLAELLEPGGPLLRVKQVHGSRVVDALEVEPLLKSPWTDSPTVAADGIVSPGTGAVLAIQTADCAPVLLADPGTGAVAAVHAGWRGAAGGVLRRAVRAMIELGASPSSMIAAIGPCICLDCYEVGEEVADHFPESCDPIKGKPSKYLLDLALAVEVSLIAAGMSSQRIDRLGVCSSCDGDQFFSYRRDSGVTGRGLGFISGRRS